MAIHHWRRYFWRTFELSMLIEPDCVLDSSIQVMIIMMVVVMMVGLRLCVCNTIPFHMPKVKERENTTTRINQYNNKINIRTNKHKQNVQQGKTRKVHSLEYSIEDCPKRLLLGSTVNIIVCECKCDTSNYWFIVNYSLFALFRFAFRLIYSNDLNCFTNANITQLLHWLKLSKHLMHCNIQQ